MVDFRKISLEELRAYNRDAQKRSRARSRGEPVPLQIKRGPRGGELVDESGDIGTAGAPSPRPTLPMLEDAWHRNCAPRSITAWVCGDPPPGRSALDQRQQVQR